MKQAEIEFCERWISFRDPDGEVWGGEWLHPEKVPGPEVAYRVTRPGQRTPYSLTPRGADLVASYEAAIAKGLEIVPDDAPSWPKIGDVVIVRPEFRHRFHEDTPAADGEPMTILGRVDKSWKIGPRVGDVVRTREIQPYKPPPTKACPDCKGEGRVPVSFAGDRTIVDLVKGPDGRTHGSPERAVLPGWDVTCPTCEGARRVEIQIINVDVALKVVDRVSEAFAEVGRAVQRFADAVDGWRPLTPELAPTLEGEAIEIRRNGRVLGQTVARGTSGDWMCIDPMPRPGGSLTGLIPSWGYEVRLLNPWITEPEAMRELLRGLPNGTPIEATWVGGEDLDIIKVESRAREANLLRFTIRSGGCDPRIVYRFGFNDEDDHPTRTWPVLTGVRLAGGAL